MGNIWATGSTAANDLQTVNPIQGSLKGTQNLFIAEFNSTGILIFSTYFGGSGTDYAVDLALDTNGQAYIVGATSSTNFPLLNPLEGSLTGPTSAFLVKIDDSGRLVYSTYLGKAVGQAAWGVAVDPSSDMFVASWPAIGNLVKLNPLGSAVVYSVAGSQGVVAADSQGNAYTVLCTLQQNGLCAPVPLIDPIQSNPTGALLFGLDPNGNVIFSSYFSNTPTSFGFSEDLFGVDSAGNLYTNMYEFFNGAGQDTPVPLLNAVDGLFPPPFT